jgi:hypothetical protein
MSETYQEPDHTEDALAEAMAALREMSAELAAEKSLREAAEARAAGQLQELQKVYAEADGERLRQTDAAHAEAAQWKAEDDWYGWNFHEGRAAGTVGASLYFGRVGRKLAALLAPAPEQGGAGDGTGGDEMDRLTSGDAAKREGE